MAIGQVTNATVQPQQNLFSSPVERLQATPKSSDSQPVDGQSEEPTDTVEISSKAEAKLKLIQINQAVADELDSILLKRQEGTPSFTTRLDQAALEKRQEKTAEILTTLNDLAAGGFKDLDGLLEDSRSGKTTTSSFSIENGISEELVTASLAIRVRALEFGGKTEQAQQLRDAAVGGSLRFQDPSKVDGLNLTYEKIVTEGPGGGQGIHYNLDQNPTGAVKDALDSGRAFTMGQGDLGAFYITLGNEA